MNRPHRCCSPAAHGNRMNFPDLKLIPDIQSTADTRRLTAAERRLEALERRLT